MKHGSSYLRRVGRIADLANHSSEVSGDYCWESMILHSVCIFLLISSGMVYLYIEHL